MSVNFIHEFDETSLPETHLLRATPSTIQRIGEARTYLFDLDDTMADYDQEFMTDILRGTLADHVSGSASEELEVKARLLAGHMHYGTAQKAILETHLDSDGIRSFWADVTGRFGDTLMPDHVSFDPTLVKLIHFISRNSFGLGVISNSNEVAGKRVLDLYEDRYGVRLHERSIFLGSSPQRKPNPEALLVYSQKTGEVIDPTRTAYVGNSISDLKFARNIGAVGVLIDPRGVILGTDMEAEDRQVVEDSLVLGGFGHLKNHIERVMPNYARTIVLRVDHGDPHEGDPIDKNEVSIAPTDENIFLVTTKAVETIVDNIPSIVSRFEHRFMVSEARNITKLPNYNSLFHNVTGSVLIPPIGRISDTVYRHYFSNNRYRVEGDHHYGRGPGYYKQMIPEINRDPARQNEVAFTEIQDSYAAILEAECNPTDNVDFLLRLAVMDNLRGNIESLYLSTINIFREGREVPDMQHLLEVSALAKMMYECSVELQYGFMLGLEIDQEQLLGKLASLTSLIEMYQDYTESNGYPLKFKTPEIENSIEIAIRAHEITAQYPDTDVFVGLSSGGVELATVAHLLQSQYSEKDTSIIHYPVSVHHGLTMWQKDKNRRDLDHDAHDFLGLTVVEGKNVVICEDNSNSGQTITHVIDTVASLGAKKVNFAVIEIDPTRILLHKVQQKIGAKHNVGQAAVRERPIANYFHPDFMGAVGVVKILLADQGINKVIAQDTANQHGIKA